MICLTMTSLVHSQTVSNNDCIVPCVTLKNALKVKVELEYCSNQLSLVRDSIHIMDKMLLQKDTLIMNKDKEIIFLNDNVKQTNQLAMEQAGRAEYYYDESQKQKRLKYLSIGGGILMVIASILFL